MRALAFLGHFPNFRRVGIFSKAKKVDPAAALRQTFGSQVASRLDANPAVQRIAMDTVQFYYQDKFLDPPTCKRLIAMIDSKRRPSTLLSDRPNSNFRTSESCDMHRWSPDVQPTDEAIATLLGIDLLHGETMQGQRYAPGQQFRAHHDYFHESESYWQKMQEQGGQRTWTAMVFLNDVPEGGATWFPQAGLKIAPKRGMLLAWNNMNPDGTPNGLTLHEGMPVMEGVKYIVTKWFRERPWIK